MSIASKITWTLGLMCVFLLILLTGRTNIKNFETVQTSIEEIYKDRLVVKGIIFDLSSLLHRKEVATIKGDKSFFTGTNDSINKEIAEKIQLFRATRLTDDEAFTLGHFEKGISDLQKAEKKTGIAQGGSLSDTQSKWLAELTLVLKNDLKTLSGIQLSEGKRKLSQSDRAVASMNTFAEAEKYILIVFAALMLALIFLVPGPRQKDNIEAQ